MFTMIDERCVKQCSDYQRTWNCDDKWKIVQHIERSRVECVEKSKSKVRSHVTDLIILTPYPLIPALSTCSSSYFIFLVGYNTSFFTWKLTPINVYQLFLEAFDIATATANERHQAVAMLSLPHSIELTIVTGVLRLPTSFFLIASPM